MKMNKKWRRLPVGKPCCSASAGPIGDRRSAIGDSFTLVELLVVIAIIAVIAALILPLAGAVRRKAYIQSAQSELAQLETAIEQYHAAYGFYPPDSPATMDHVPINQLYYELVGTTNVAAPGSAPIYQVLGDPSQQLKAADVQKIFNVAGFMNCDKAGAGQEAAHAQDFLPGLKSTQFAEDITNSSDPTVPFTMLVTSVGGPDGGYPLGISDANPWRYNSSHPTNNPASYDLYVQLVIGGTTNLICNWSKQVQINSPLP